MVHAAIRLGQNLAALAAPAAPPTTWNPAAKDAAILLSGGNLVATVNSPPVNTYGSVKGTNSRSSGLLHFEITFAGATSDAIGIGLCNAAAAVNNYAGVDSNSVGYFNNGNVGISGGVAAVLPTFGNQTVALEVDIPSLLVYFQVFGGPRSAGISIAAISGALFPMWTGRNAGNVGTANFGASAFLIAPTAGYSAWG